MAASIDYYFTLISPYSYLGHTAFLDVVAKHGGRVVYKPLNLAAVHAVSGALPLAQRPEVRKRYRLVELQRIAEIREQPITLKPAYFPTDASLAHGAVAGILSAGGDPATFIYAAYQACWVNDLDIAQPETIRALLTETGHDEALIMAAATSDAILAQIEANTQDALAIGAVGAPTYVLNGEPFWGQDRIEYLDHALASGRGPYSAD